ncbi:MAG: helix-turn-helix domain-containing protein [Actinomycetia bacterium]|nr:helix-turn-helix domain-containing protein [Actinomycetes bacterium]
MSVLGVAEAAAELRVSPRRVRQMLADGGLVGERVGRVWVIEPEQLRRVERHRPAVGRPWSPVSAWAVLALAGGEDPDLSPVERSRARKRLAQGLEGVVGRLASRADRRWFYGHPGVFDRLADDREVVRAGISAVVDHEVDLVVGDGFEGYVMASNLAEGVERFGLDGRAVRPNVLLRVVDDAVWPFQPGQASAGRAVVAVDLLESEEPRSRRLGADLLDVE